LARIDAADLKNGMKVVSSYIVKSKKLIPYKNKPGHFMNITLADSTGQVEAKVWDNAEDAFGIINAGDLLEVNGDVRDYNGAPQLNINSFRQCSDDEFSPESFLPATPKNIAEMLAELQGFMDSIQNRHLRNLLRSFFDDRQWVDMFCTAPAAKANHQAYLGGLLEHTLNVARNSLAAVKLYPRLDRDLMLAGSILHDIGKIEEYSFHRFIDFTDEGRLLGHIVMGVNEVDRRIRLIGENDPFPADLRLKILHIITSHHGLYEWQSPKRPKILEAAVIHTMDMLDTVVDAFSKVLDDPTGDNSAWSSWNRTLERYIYLK